MPRPRNEVLRKFLTKIASNEYVCNNGKCENRLLNQHVGTMERHLKFVHPEIFARYMHKKIAWKQKLKAAAAVATMRKQQKTEKTKVTAVVATTQTQQKTEKTKVAAAVATTQKQPKTENTKKNHNFELAIVELFTKGKQPLSLLEQRAFKILVQPAFESLGIQTDKQSVLELINKFSQKTKCDIIKDLTDNCTLYTLAICISEKEGKHALMCVSVQYIRDHHIENRILSIRLLDREYTGESLKMIIIDILNEYKIDLQQILSITTSNHTNIIEAINSMNDELENVFNEEGAVVSKSIKTETNDMNDCTDEGIEYSTSDSATHKITTFLGGVHIFKLCVEMVYAKEEVKRVLDKCRTVIKDLIPQTLKDTKDILKSATDWISTYRMITHILKIEDINIFIHNQDINILKILADLLKLVGVAETKLENGKICYSDLFIVIMNLVFDLEKITNEKSTVKCLIDALNWHKQKLLDIDQFSAAVYLDPRIRVCLDAAQKQRAKQYITKLHDRICVLKSRSNGGGIESVHSETSDGLRMHTNTTQPASTTNPNPSSPKSFSDYLQNLENDSTSATFSCLEADITLYERQPRLPLETNIIDFWYFQRNSLTDVARLILATPWLEINIEDSSLAIEFCLPEDNRLSKTEMEKICRIMASGTFSYEE